MGFLKELFDNAENGALNYEQFEAACKNKNIKLADLSKGEYVSKSKYDNDIATRETDLKTAREQLATANGDAEKLKTVTADLEALQGKYAAQAYEYAVKDYANNKNFSSKAAKRDFVSSMIAKKLTVENGQIIGADDFAKTYASENGDAFVTEKEEPKKPQFVANTTPQTSGEMTKAEFRRLNYTERAKLFQENQELYNKLKE